MHNIYCPGTLYHGSWIVSPGVYRWRYKGTPFRIWIKWNDFFKENTLANVQYISRNMHMVFALLCFVVVIHWLIFPYPPGLLRWHCGNLTIAPVPAKQPWWIWINTSCEIIMNDYTTSTKQSTTKPCAYILGYTVVWWHPFRSDFCLLNYSSGI